MRYLYTIALLFLVTMAQAQKDTAFLLVRSYTGDVVDAALDNLNNLYIVSSTGQIKKLDSRGDSVAVFNGMRNFGKLSALDVSNPLKPLMFYKDFSTVVVLDRLFAIRSRIDLRRQNILQPTAIGLSYDNNIWVFDQYDNKLKKIDESGNTLLETPDFRQLFDQAFAPQKIVNDNGLLYLADSAHGVLVFDNYGTFKRKIDVKNWAALDIWNGRLVRLQKDAVVVYNPTTFIEQSQTFPQHFKAYQRVFTTGNQLVTFSPDTLRVYRFGN